MLQAASAWFSSSQILQNYAIATPGTATAISSSSPSTTASPAPISVAPPFTVGPWKVQEASHKTTQKRASIWTCDKRSTEMERIGASGKEMVIEVLKAEASALGRLRHPCVLEMVEPLEETRSELIFATELVLSSLSLAIHNQGSSSSSSSRNAALELDEIEIQKGILQLTKGLAFLHQSARLVHSNLKIGSVVLNSLGDWKICGLGLTIPFTNAEGKPTPWEFPAFDNRLPPYIQRSFDYMAPEYALEEQIAPASDFYSLGCIIYAVHAKGEPPFRNRGNLGTLRSNVGRLEGGGGVRGMDAWDQDVRSLVNGLVTAKTHNRLTAQTLPTHSYFSSLAMSTLNFLDRSNFASKSREEKIAFMKGLTTVLPRFSEGMKRRKILPSLLEEMKDPLLLSSILPNVFVISSNLDPTQFQALVLPSLKPLFAIKDPPIVMMVLLENLEMLQSKTSKQCFKADVLPLVYNALESEHAAVQERALAAVPALCETIDYSEVQSVLFPRVALVFTKTRILSVKVSTLTCFVSMVKTLDQSSLTQKLVPLLSKIRTKEPAVMMATLQVHEAMGLKVEREAVATLVLPQLWAMCVGPLLNVEQFGRFMQVIKVLGDRIEKEHTQYLRDSQRVEDKSAAAASNGIPSFAAGPVDFESLVGGGKSPRLSVTSPPGVNGGAPAPAKSWEDDVWGSILNGNESPNPGTSARNSLSQTPTPRTQSPAISPMSAIRPAAPATASRTSTTQSSLPSVRALGAKPLHLQNAARAVSTPPPLSPPQQLQPTTFGAKPSFQQSSSLFTAPPTTTSTPAFTPLQPKPMGGSPFTSMAQPQQQQSYKPNYNIVLPSASNVSNIGGLGSATSSFGSGFPPPLQPQSQNPPPLSFTAPPPMQPQQPSFPPPQMGMGMGLLQPSKAPQPAWGGGTGQKNAALSDFDPLL
ncbi:hypothetical protein M407DRAFT_26107 [Tulasnella calospora MUT 4182]|uniref:Protein kinase domain-containing protein n=1 Tax=Tulasnella calospora MUT 4182 TaxID=1051891 RepID=A0A0C3KSQ0_9AGAM|nr:hypothetical protein M407DRAFT_26107 [Tulasnella calospora MUT 4182]